MELKSKRPQYQEAVCVLLFLRIGRKKRFKGECRVIIWLDLSLTAQGLYILKRVFRFLSKIH